MTDLINTAGEVSELLGGFEAGEMLEAGMEDEEQAGE